MPANLINMLQLVTRATFVNIYNNHLGVMIFSSQTIYTHDQQTTHKVNIHAPAMTRNVRA